MVTSVVLGGYADVRLKPHSGTVPAFVRGTSGDNFILDASREGIKNYMCDGHDLIIEFVDGQRLTIKNFFANGVDYHNLVLNEEGGRQLVDFSHALSAEGKAFSRSDGIDEMRIVHRALFAEESAHAYHLSSQAIDYNFTSATENFPSDVPNQKSGFRNFLTGKSVLSVLGGAAAIGGGYGFLSNDDKDDESWNLTVKNPFDDIPDLDPLIPGPPEDDEAPQKEDKGAGDGVIDNKDDDSAGHGKKPIIPDYGEMNPGNDNTDSPQNKKDPLPPKNSDDARAPGNEDVVQDPPSVEQDPPPAENPPDNEDDSGTQAPGNEDVVQDPPPAEQDPPPAENPPDNEDDSSTQAPGNEDVVQDPPPAEQDPPDNEDGLHDDVPQYTPPPVFEHETPAPEKEDVAAENEGEGKHLSFFKAGNRYLVETRIVGADSRKFNEKGEEISTFSSAGASFFMPIFIGDKNAKANGKAVPELYFSQTGGENFYKGVYALADGVWGEGEKAQFRINGSGKWYDAVYNETYGRWEFSKADAEALHANAPNGLYWVDSRVVNSNGGEDQFARNGSVLIHNDFYRKLPSVVKEEIAIARIDYTKADAADDPWYSVYDPFEQAQDIVLGGKIMGHWDKANKVQIRFNGSGWYDVAEVNIQDETNVFWHFEDLPTLISSNEWDLFQLKDGHSDTIVYRLLNDKSASGGNGFDVIKNFKLGKFGEADVDRIDVSSLLIDYDDTKDINHYLTLEKVGGGGVELQIDRDGTGDRFGYASLLFLEGHQFLTSKELLDNGQLIVT